MRMDWAVYKSRHQAATLETFGAFMSGLVAAASEVSFELPGMWTSTKGEKRKSSEFGMLHTHSTDSAVSPETIPSPSTPQPTAKAKNKLCWACGRTGHRVADCEQFRGANLDERWRLVEQKGLCRTCLNSHGRWPCKSWTGCGIDGCRQRHHTLLHTPPTPPEKNRHFGKSRLFRRSSLAALPDCPS